MDQRKLEERLRDVMVGCGRPHYILRPVGRGRLIITADPIVRQTPLTNAELECIRKAVAGIRGWRLDVRGRPA